MLLSYTVRLTGLPAGLTPTVLSILKLSYLILVHCLHHLPELTLFRSLKCDLCHTKTDRKDNARTLTPLPHREVFVWGKEGFLGYSIFKPLCRKNACRKQRQKSEDQFLSDATHLKA